VQISAQNNTEDFQARITILQHENELLKQSLVQQQQQFREQFQELESRRAESGVQLEGTVDVRELLKQLEESRHQLSTVQEEHQASRIQQEAKLAQLTAEKKKLEADVEITRNASRSNEALTKEAAILKEDRKLLGEEYQRIQSERSALSQENLKLREEVEALTIGMQAMTSQIEDMTVRLNEKEAVPIKTRSIRANMDDKSFQQKYGLPDTEFPITYFNCSNRNLNAGYLYITPKYLVFDVYVGIFAGTKTRDVVPIADITSVNKMKLVGFLPGKGSDVEIRTKDGIMHLFRNFMKRKEAIKNILQQASNLSMKIDVLRNGIPDAPKI